MEIFSDAQVVLSTFRSRNFSNKPLHFQGIHIQFPRPSTLAHNVAPSTVKNQVFTSAIKFDFPPFTNTLSATLAGKVFAFITQTFSLQQGLDLHRHLSMFWKTASLLVSNELKSCVDYY